MSQLGDKISGSGSNAGGRPLDGKELIFREVPDSTPKKVKHQSPQDAIDEFWKKFDTKTPGIASTILPKNLLAKKASEKTPKGFVKAKNAGASYEEAVAICKDKVEKIVRECHRTNTKYLDPHFDIETDLMWDKDCLTQLKCRDGEPESSAIPEGVKRVGDIFEDPKFFVEGASSNDIRQGSDGDCWFLAALATLANKKDLIERICVARDEKVGVYGFVFHRDGEWVSEIIDDKLYLIKPDYDESWLERMMLDGHRRINSEEEYKKLYQTGSSALFFAQCEDPNETWLPLLEKAYAKAHGDYSVIEGGFTGEGVEDLTGGVTTELFITDILDKDYFWKEELLKVNEEFLFGCWAYFRGYGSRKGIVEGHAYSVMKAVEVDGQRLVLLRNPWGEYEWKGPWSDGSKEWTPEWMTKLEHRFGDDGVFWMSYDDLMKKYQLFDRTRLFSNEWKVTQQWTTVTIPWNVDYNDTKFTFTLEKKSSVVIVLSQLDTRYFGGLEGQYDFALSFRVHKSGEQAYLVRSYNKYNMSRSTTAELELEAGEYNVLMKLEARRNEGRWPVEKVVRENAKGKREKLVRIGLSYDMAHAKGHIEETEEEKAGKKKAEDAKKAKEKKETKDKLMKEKKKRKHNENKEKRKQRAAKLKRQAKAKAKAAKRAQKEKEAKPEVKDEPKADEKKADETKTAEPGTEAATADKPTDAPAEPAKPTETPEPAKPDTTAAPASTAAPQTLEIRVTGPNNRPNPSAPPSIVSFLGNDDDDDDDSDINSDVSDISDGEIEDYIAEQKLAAEQIPPPPPNPEEEEDEFEADPWNAVAVVGLRVYSKESGVSVKVVRPREWEDGEGKLDVDDSAADATKDVTAEKKSESEEIKKEEEMEVKAEGETEVAADKKDEETAKSEGGSEGSGVVV